MKNEDYLNILYSPQWVSKILHLYISGACSQNKNGIKNELIYCVLPILTNDDIREKLSHANNKSSFFTIFEKDMKDRQEFTFNISQQLMSFFQVTNNGLIYLTNRENITYDIFISTNSPVNTKSKSFENDDEKYFRSAYYLGLIFGKANYIHIFLKLGISQL